LHQAEKDNNLILREFNEDRLYNYQIEWNYILRTDRYRELHQGYSR